jgi:adenine phosphoribosyltransferase
MSYKDFITEVPNFPKDGIGFKDISPLLADQETFRSSLVDMGGYFDDNLPDYWIGIDSRGFTFAGGLATYFGGGVVCARKEGKLPNADCSESYNLEYGTATLEMKSITDKGKTAVIVDDVLATGGTMLATNKLALQAGYDVIGRVVLIDLKFIPKIARLQASDMEVKSVIKYD